MMSMTFPPSGSTFATMSVANILSDTATRQGERPAVHFAGTTTTYAQLWEETRRYAGALRGLGITVGSRVALMAPNVPDFPRAYYAILSLGAIVVPVHPLFKTDEIAFVLRDSEADLLIAAAPFLADAGAAAAAVQVPLTTVLLPEGAAPGVPRLEAQAVDATPLDEITLMHPLAPATILYTSGTSGTPKGAVSSHLSIIEQVHCALIDSLELRVDDVLFGGLPLFHTFGQTAVMNTAFRRGASIVLLPRFEAEEALALMHSHDVTVLCAVPTMFIDLLRAADAASSKPHVRLAISGGAALPAVIHDRFHDSFGARIHEGYGLTETNPVVSFNRADEMPHPGTAGRPLWGVQVAIADALIEERIVLLDDPAAVGEVVVRGHNLFNGYLNAPSTTAATVVDGWFRTGDLGVITDGLITIVDRKKDMIIRNGYNVYPTEVENALAAHTDVLSVSVFGVSDDRTGQEIHAAYVLRDGAELGEDALIEFAREHIGSHKYPRIAHRVDALPLGASGKVLRRSLVDQFGG
ncbi:long-chain acyl-CoA synthetase [Microbacterium sp. ZKA21]